MSKQIWSAAIYRRFLADFRPFPLKPNRNESATQNKTKSGNKLPHSKLLLLLAAISCLWATAAAHAGMPVDEPPAKTREIYVPVSDLKVLLESEPHRVLLSRQEYDELVKKAKKSPETHVPHPTAVVSSDYEITVEEGRARLHGTIVIDVLEDGLHAVPLDLGGVGLLAAKLDDQPAPIGYAADGRLNLLVSGPGRCRLALDMVAPLEMNSAQQFLSFRLTNAAVGRWRLSVPGDVEIKGGADVTSRVVDEAAKITRFDLLPRSGDCTILMSLNSHLQRREQAVASRCVLFDEVTEAYEKLHATVTFWILHRATDRFRFVVPQGFEITEINSPLLARWDIETEGGRKIVNVRLREQTTDTVVLSVAAIKTPSQLKPWRMPRLELLDVVGQVTVLGLLVENELKVESLAATDLIPVDTGVLATALPATLVRPEPGAVLLRYIAAYYAPQGGYELKADLSRTPTTLAVTTNLLLNIQEQGCEVQGGFALLPTAEKRFAFDFSVPAGWTVIEVTGPDKVPLPIERYATLPSPSGRGAGGEGGRVHVKLPQGIAPGQVYVANFRARYTPPGWLSPWKSQTLEFPMFHVADAQRDEGAVAVVANEDMEVTPEKVERLVPITEGEMARFGLPKGATNLAYRYEAAGGKATIAVDRTKSRVTARTFAFFQVEPDVLRAHYVVIYTIEDAKTRHLALLLPDSTPQSITISGLEGVVVKEFTPEPAAGMRRWNVLLDAARRGEVRLAVDFEMRPQLPSPSGRGAGGEGVPPALLAGTVPRPSAPDAITELKDFALPLVQAEAVYQSGVVAIEGDLELGVDVQTKARRADVGQLAIAKYTPASLEPNQQPGQRGLKQAAMRLLGTYEFVGDPPKVAVDVVRNPSYALTPAIVQRARLATLLSADGTSQTQATFQLLTKAPYLEVELPDKASLWSAVLDGTPLKPQKRGGIRLIGLPPGATAAVRNLQLVYEAPVQSVTNGGKLNLAAPRLLYRASQAGKSTEIPLVNIEWTVTVPDGYEAVATDGTLEAKPIARPLPAPLAVAGTLYELGGGGFSERTRLISNLSGGASTAAGKNEQHQFGMAIRDGEDVFYSPTRRRAGPTQDNMISELEAAAKDENSTQWGVYEAEVGKKKAAPFLARPAAESPKADAPPPPQPAAAPLPRVPTVEDGRRPAPAAPPAPVGFRAAEIAHLTTPGAPAAPAIVLNNTGMVVTGVPTAPGAPAASAPPAPPAAAASLAPTAGYGSLPLHSDVVNVTGGSASTYALEMSFEPAKPAGGSPDGRGSVTVSGGVSYAAPKGPQRQENLSGFRSLKIDVQQAGMDQRQLLTFSSLGADPHIGITLARRNRTEALAWFAFLAVFLLGVALTKRPLRQKAALVLGLALASALVPLAWDTVSMAEICNGVFYAASLLVPYYLVAGLVRWILRGLCGLAGRIGQPPAPAAVTAALVLALITLFSATTQAQPAAAQNLTAEREEYEAPVAVPDDAIIVPYDVKSKTGVKDADHLLVPYDRYVELWNLVHPDKKIDAHPAPLPFALSGATYSAVLEGEETLNLTGKLQIDVLADGYVSIPLNLRGGVLARADLDGKPAQLKVVSAAVGQAGKPDVRMPTKGGKPAAAMDATLLMLQVSGKGTHKLALEVRLKLGRLGGWRGTTAWLPTAPAATVTFRVPQPQTEVRLGQAVDRRTHETQRPDETLETALGPGGALQVQWRPKVAEAQVDRGLTVETASRLDVEEDGLRMALHVKLEFRRGQRDDFTLTLPADYLVEKVAGGNVRGWEVRRPAVPGAQGDQQTVDVSLLKTAKDGEQFNLFLSRNGKVGQAPLDSFAVPMVTVRDAALSSGQLTIRRSPLLDVRTTERSGLTRIDLGTLPDLSGGPATEESVLAIRAFEAYHFPTTPFVLRLSAAPIAAEVTAQVQTSVKLDPIEPGLESKIIFHVGQRRIYRFEVAVPGDLRLPEVTLPSSGIWSIEKEPVRQAFQPDRELDQGQAGKPDVRKPDVGATRSILKIHLQQGVLGDAAVILRGKLPVLDARREIALPRLEVLGVKRQEGDIAVQADPAFNVQSRELHDCQETELERVAAWLDPQYRAATRLALHYAGGAYAGTLRLVPRTPDVVCDTVTNVRVTDRAIEETIFLNYSIHNAGIHELGFLLPASMADARISTPMLRRKTVAAVDPKVAGSPLRVRLELQGDVMNDLRVLIQNDRLLTPGSEKDPHTAPLPGFEAAAGGPTGLVRHQYAVLQTSNRDELVDEPLVGLEALSRQQQQWQALSELLGTKRLYQAYLVQPGARQPRLSFYLQRHEEVETAGARIDLAQTTIVVDANGAYRAKVELSLDNSSEQFLDVELPEGATLWTVHVAGEPVKPAQVPGAKDARHVLLPVRKTAKGDPNYPVVLKYGGKLPPLSVTSGVEFPLVRNVKSYPRPGNIGIEQSQVEIFVPKSHQWFAFGGTMHETADEADLKAGRIAAFNKQGERLIEASRDKDLFVRARARENLKNWDAEAKTIQEGAGRAGANKALQSQISANSGVTLQAKEVLKSAGDQQQQDFTADDNRDRLNDLYQKQEVVNAGELVLSGNNTFNGGTAISAGTLQVVNGGAAGTLQVGNRGAAVDQNGTDFNGNWLARNNLGNPDFTQQDAGSSGPYFPPGTQADLTKAGAGALTLTGSNTYSGTTSHSGVTVQLPNLANGRIILNNDQFGGQGNVGNVNPGFTNYKAIGATGGQSLAQAGQAATMNWRAAAGTNWQPAEQGQPSMPNAAPTAQQPYAPSSGYAAPAGQSQAAGQSQMPNPGPTVQQAYGRRSGVRVDQQRELAEYEQKLAMANANSSQPQAQGGQQQVAQPGVSGEYANLPPPSAVPPSDSRVAAQPSAVTAAAGATWTIVGNGVTGAFIVAPTAPAGLASLDFELPTDKNLYEVYRFTTPRGDAELTARTVSNSALGRLELLTGIAAASLLIWAGFWLIGRGVLGWFRRPLGAILLAVAGFAALCSGLLPFAGLLAMLAGIGLLVAHFWRRRAAAV